MNNSPLGGGHYRGSIWIEWLAHAELAATSGCGRELEGAEEPIFSLCSDCNGHIFSAKSLSDSDLKRMKERTHSLACVSVCVCAMNG